jgi:hypothetical protein
MISKLLVFILFLFLMAGCKPETGKKGTQSESGEIMQTDTLSRTRRTVYYRFPSARKMLDYVKSENFNFRPDLINPAENIDKYTDTKSKALNLGVYLSDFFYMLVTDNTLNTHTYFDAIMRLISDLRISVPEQDEIIQSVDNNIHNADSLIRISEEYYTGIIDYLLKTDKEKTFAIISTGSYIEGLYIALNVIDDYTGNEGTAEKIAEQKYAFNNLMHFTKTYEEDLNVKHTLGYLIRINKHLSELSVQEGTTKVKRVDSNRFVFEGGDQVKINRDQFTNLRNVVTEIRSEIIENK